MRVVRPPRGLFRRRAPVPVTLTVQRRDAGAFAADGELHPMQQAPKEHDAFKCGYCTSGQIMSAVKLLEEGNASTDEEIAEFMSGNICRCAAYPERSRDERFPAEIQASASAVPAMQQQLLLDSLCARDYRTPGRSSDGRGTARSSSTSTRDEAADDRPIGDVGRDADSRRAPPVVEHQEPRGWVSRPVEDAPLRAG
jgi:hypothetical protein